MPLRYETQDIEDYRVHFPQPAPNQLHPKIQSLVFLSIPCGFNRIEYPKVDDVWRRVNLYQRAIGAMFNESRVDPEAWFPPGTPEQQRITVTPIMVDREDILLAVGLRTNASTLTKSQFLNRLWDVHTRV